MAKIGRNDPCSCGSGKKYKKCCEKKSSIQRHTFVNLNTQVTKKSMDKITGRVFHLGCKTISNPQTKVRSLNERISASQLGKHINANQEEKSAISDTLVKKEPN